MRTIYEEIVEEKRRKRRAADLPTGGWVLCPISVMPGVQPHAVSVQVRSRIFAACDQCGLMFWFVGAIWRVRNWMRWRRGEAPKPEMPILSMTAEQADAACAILIETKARWAALAGVPP